MKPSRIFLPFLFCLFPIIASAQDFSGSHTMKSEMGSFVLQLRSSDGASYEGELVGEEGVFVLTGAVEDGVLVGMAGVDYESYGFTVSEESGGLAFTLYEFDEHGGRVAGSEETLFFEEGSAAGATSDGEVSINGRALSGENRRLLEETYGVKPMPGEYWYDGRSGLYGVVGYQSFGFMLPDHNFGAMEADASNGDTGVYVNGRELPAAEYTVWSYMVGSWIQPGRYWLDHQGNAGFEGNPIPTINLYAAAQQSSYSGQGGSGDNFWSTRFSAGNYDSGNTRGYVSVPGHGPVGYGF